jgi:hypothetical protein
MILQKIRVFENVVFLSSIVISLSYLEIPAALFLGTEGLFNP